VWGGGIYPETYFYDICDELGLMVWQDFMFACAQYSLDDEKFVESIKNEISDNIKRLRHHASLALWCGNNEMEWLWVDSQTDGRSKEQMDEYLELFEVILPPIAAKEDPDRLYWPASPSSGGNFDNPNDENRGDVHYWDVWHGLKPFTEYRKFYFRFCSEFGFQSFPSLKTVESYTVPEDRNIFSYVMESHQKNGGANGKILYYLSENFKNPKDFESLLYVSQLLQAEAIKYGVEHWRRNRGRCMGSIYWQFNDCWPVASWSSIDSFHRWKALHYFAKRFYSPVLASAEDNGTNVDIHISNESRNDSFGTLRWKLMDRDGTVWESGSMDAVIEKLSSKAIVSLDFTDKLNNMDVKRKTILWYEYTDDAGNRSGSSLLFVPNKYFIYENPRIAIDLVEDGDSISLKLSASSYAGYVCIESSKYDLVFSDNFFSLIPGNEKIVSIEKSSADFKEREGNCMDDLTVTSIFDSY
jgi:beta-mannosidase